MYTQNNNKAWMIAVVVLVAVNIATLTTIWMGKGKPIQHQNSQALRGGAIGFLIKELGFDSTQRQMLDSIKDKHHEEMSSIRTRLRAAKEAYFGLLSDSSISDDALQSAVAKELDVQKEMELITFHHFSDIRQLCNATQKKRFDSLLTQVVSMMAAPPRPHMHPSFPKDGKPEAEGPPPPREDDGRPPFKEGNPPPPPREE